MRFSRLRIGMTLIELMVVVAIIAALAGIFAVVMVNNESNTAYIDVSREITTLFEAQRMRAMSMSVPTYIVFNMDGNNVQSIEPRLGANNGFTVCAIEDPNERRQMIPLRYDENFEENVAIDISTPDLQRTSEVRTSDRYKTDDTPYTRVRLFRRNVSPNAAFVSDPVDQQMVVCFQPNGMVYFIRNNGGFRLDLDTELVELRIRANANIAQSPGEFRVSVNSLGMIEQTKVLDE